MSCNHNGIVGLVFRFHIRNRMRDRCFQDLFQRNVIIAVQDVADNEQAGSFFFPVIAAAFVMNHGEGQCAVGNQLTLTDGCEIGIVLETEDVFLEAGYGHQAA